MSYLRRNHLFALLLITFCLVTLPDGLQAQDDIPLNLKRARGVEMLEAIREELKDVYYDPSFKGVNIEANFKAAKEQIKVAERTGQVNAIIAQFLLDLDDSHTFFLPADRIGFVDYGVTFQIIGKKCYISFVKKDSDAEKKGVKVGDLVYSIETFEPTRESLWKLNYFYRTLSPQERLRLVFENSPGVLREVVVAAKLVTWEKHQKELSERRKKERSARWECKPLTGEIVACKLRTFIVTEGDIDKMMKEVGNAKGLVLDLRRNGGGYVKTLRHLVGYFFDRDIKIGTEKTRKSSKDEIAPFRKNKVFSGNVSVIVDSASGSASEVFARVLQLEKRGTVIGDRSAGAVMTSIRVGRPLINRTTFPLYNYIPYGASITVSDLIMSDGNSLEKVGVEPDILLLPNHSDMRGSQDTVLAKAIELVGGTLAPDEASKVFTVDMDDDGWADPEQ